ncbi:unnamed protein product [Heligmosomoides polygyrus]|uniref:Endo/exonuclease/phosphatase domain-containing protein n=1 Tax=Heligmosomoides polygyrus TaxID=6339 RepID=A0A183FEY1_HELPZ|nr:unnamed protein product [Heligmosomoides polygyrus]
MSFSPAKVVSILLAEFGVPDDNDAPTREEKKIARRWQLFYVAVRQLQLMWKRMKIWDQMCLLMTSPIGQDPRSYAECGYVDGPLVRVGRGTGAKTNRLMCGTGDEVVLLTTSGVGVIVSERFRDAIISMERFNDRLMKVVVAAEQRMYHFYSAYAPQAGCSERAKDELCTLLDGKTAEVPSEDAVVIAGDINGHVGTAKYGRSCHGGFGYGARNADGERILEYADSHNLIIANTVFRDSHLVSFYSGSIKTDRLHPCEALRSKAGYRCEGGAVRDCRHTAPSADMHS